MKRFALIALSAFFLSTGCRKIEVDDNGNNNTGTGGGTTENLILSGKINSDRTLESGKTYKLRGTVYIVDGAKLTVQPVERKKAESAINANRFIVIYLKF